MKTLNRFALGLAVAAVITVQSPLPGRAVEAGPQGPHHPLLRERAKERLNLTDDQVTQIKQELKAEKEALAGIAARLREARAALRAEVQNPTATETSVREAAGKVAVVESDLAVERLRMRGKLTPILTEEQRAKLDKAGAHRNKKAGLPHKRGHKPPVETIE